MKLVLIKRSVTAIAVACLLQVILLAVPVAAQLGAGNTGWMWANPQPQGNTLNRVVAVGGRLWAGGAAGTLMRSDDGGASWTSVRTGLLDSVRTIDAITPDSVVFAGSCALRRTDDAGATVRRLPWGLSDDSCAAQIQAVSFPQPMIGYLLLTSGDIYLTNDGGASWRKLAPAPGSQAAGGSDAVSDIAFSGPTAGVLGAGPHIYRTLDGGQTWELAADVPQGGIHFDFADKSIGYAAGSSGLILRTLNAGFNWEPVQSTEGQVLPAIGGIDCRGPEACSVITQQGSGVFTTTDGGAGWQGGTPLGGGVNSAALLGPSRVVAVGLDGLIAVSGDSGASWSQLEFGAGGQFDGLRTLSKRRQVVFGANGALADSLDGGATWRALAPAGTAPVVDVAASGRRLFALDNAGKLWRSDGGAAWAAVRMSGARARGIYAWSRNRLALVGPRGVRISTKSGAGPKAVRGVVARMRLTKFDPARRALFAFGSRAIATSANKGRTWSRVAVPKKSAKIVQLDMVDRRNGYLLDRDAELYKTKSGGRHWMRIETTGANVAVSVAFGDSRHGYLTDNSGRVLATSDGGATWLRQYPFFDLLGKSNALVAATGRRSASLLVEGTNRVFTTKTGGLSGLRSKLTLAVSARRVKRGSIVRVTGTLTPATGLERVSVLAREAHADGGTRWVTQERTVSAAGTFTTSWRITKPTVFIARWSGDTTHDGASAAQQSVSLRH